MTGEPDSDEDGYPDQPEPVAPAAPAPVDRDDAERADRERHAVERGQAWPFPVT